MQNLVAAWDIDCTQTIGMIFDVDELLFDNSREIFLAYKFLLDSRGTHIDEGEKFVGRNLFDIISKIKQKYDIDDDVKELVEERKRKYIELLSVTTADVKKGVKEVLTFLDQNRKKLNVRLGYATSSEKVFSDIIIKRVFLCCGLEGYINNGHKFFYYNSENQMAATCWEPGLEKKPSPMLYTKTVEKMGLIPAQCIAFEDSASGVEAALSAGLNVIVIPSLFNEEVFKNLEPNVFKERKICKMSSFLDFLPILFSLVK